MRTWKKMICLLLVLLMVMMTACGTSESNSESASGSGADAGENNKKICYLTSSALGDDPLVDSIWEAVESAGKDFGMTTKCVELNNDTSLYASSVMDLCESGEWDLIITGFYQMVDPVTEAVEEYPDQKFLVFDTELDYPTGNFDNCVSVEGLQNEGSFLAGVLAACLTTSGIEGFNEDKVVSFIGASPSVTLDDFLVGYIDGVKYVDPSIEVLYSYSGSFTDLAASAEHALAHFEQGADISYAVMGAAGLGVADAALQKGVYMIGVDTDLAAEVSDNNAAMAQHIVTSCCKNYQVIIYDQVKAYAEGTLELGKHTRYGLAENGMYLCDNEYYQAVVTDEIKAVLEEAAQKVIDGEIVVSTTIGASDEEYAEMLKRAKAD